MENKISQEQIDAIKNSIRKSQMERAENPSGFNNLGHGTKLTSNSAKLSSKNFDRLMQERGIKPEDAKALKQSFQEYHQYKGSGTQVNVRHVLKPESARNYNNGKNSSGVFQTTDNYSDSRTAKNLLALPQMNDASNCTETVINPNLKNGKQHNVIEGTAAQQDKDGKVFNKYREGGGKQIVADGGYASGAVSKGASSSMNAKPINENKMSR